MAMVTRKLYGIDTSRNILHGLMSTFIPYVSCRKAMTALIQSRKDGTRHRLKQYNRLKKTLEESNSKFKFVFAHHLRGCGRGGVLLAKTNEWRLPEFKGQLHISCLSALG
ncbi:MAG: hypothetical protein U0T81_12425 [Saprospiraceae bacterium]